MAGLSKRSLLGGVLALCTASPARAARPLIAHLDLADVPIPKGAMKRDLSVDPDTGASTVFFDFPANWVGGGVAHYHSFSEEIYVISGAVTLNGRDQLVGGSYLYRPGGIVHGHHEASGPGARFIGRMGGKLDFNYVREPTSEEEYVLKAVPDGRPHIVHLRTTERPWTKAADGHQIKVLSEDRVTGARTALLHFPTGWTGRMQLDPKNGWEWFAIRGTAALDDGTAFAKDSYANRPVGAPACAIVRAESETLILMWRNA